MNRLSKLNSITYDNSPIWDYIRPNDHILPTRQFTVFSMTLMHIFFLASVTQQDTGPLKDATKTSRCQVIALLCAIVITWLTSLYSWESLMTRRYNWPFHDLEWKFKIYGAFPLFDPTNILGTCQKLAGGMGVGILNLGSEMRWPIPAREWKFANPPLELVLNILPLIYKW